MTPFDVVFDTFDEGGDAVLAALAAAGFVVVACPPGGRVVVDRTEQPCPECQTPGWPFPFRCRVCGGSGVVEATTIHGLEQWSTATLDDGYSYSLTIPWGEKLSSAYMKPGKPATTFPLYRLVAAVALPEEGESEEAVYTEHWSVEQTQANLRAAVALPEETPQ